MKLRTNPKRTPKALSTTLSSKRGGRGGVRGPGGLRGRPKGSLSANKPAKAVSNLFGGPGRRGRPAVGRIPSNKSPAAATSSKTKGSSSSKAVAEDEPETIVKDDEQMEEEEEEADDKSDVKLKVEVVQHTTAKDTTASVEKKVPEPENTQVAPSGSDGGGSADVEVKETEEVPKEVSQPVVSKVPDVEQSVVEAPVTREKPVPVAVSTFRQERQLVVRLDKIDAVKPKRTERVVVPRKSTDDSKENNTARRSGKQPVKMKQVDENNEGKTTGEKDKDRDERSFERFYVKVKETSVVSERWSFGGVLWDPTKKMKVMAASEVDVTSSGNMRLRRCVQVFEDMTVRVMVEGADMTNTFTTTGTVRNVNDVAQLIHKVATSKICSGIKNFGSTDKVYFPHCVLRGESYFAPECPIVIDYGVVGPLCPHCNRLRNMIHRRNVKETNLLYSKFSRAPVKNIRSGFGKQLYSMLTDMIEASSVDAKKERKKLRRMIPANAKEYPFRHDVRGGLSNSDGGGVSLDENQQIQLQQHQFQIQLAQQQLQMQQQQQQQHHHQHQQQLQKYIQSDSSGNITISSLPGGNTIVTPSTVSSSEYIRLAKPYGSQNLQSEMMTFNVVSSSGQRGSYKVAREGGQISGSSSGSSGNFASTIGGTMLTPGEMHMVEQLVLQEGHDVGNVIIQNSGDFTLAEGQEYELIGEADPNNPIQVLEVLKEQNEANNTIEIIEVDDQTLAQLTSQNLSNFIIQEPSGDFEVQEIDANDPNFRHLVKALNPSAVVYQS